MASPARRAPAKSARSAIPQLSWRAPQPAPIVLVSGPEEVCAERAIAGVRDYLRAEDPTLEVSCAPGVVTAVVAPAPPIVVARIVTPHAGRAPPFLSA